MKKLTEQQKELDEKKYFASEQAQKDMSGGMDYCLECQFRNHPNKECKLTHESRVSNSACAKNYNRRYK